MPSPQSEAGEELEKIGKAFLSCLTRKSVFFIKQLPEDDLDADESAALRQIYEHFKQSDPAARNTIPSPSRSNQVSNTNTSIHNQSSLNTPHDNITPTQKKRGRPKKLKDDPSTPDQSNEPLETTKDINRLDLGLEGRSGASIDDYSGLNTLQDKVKPARKKRGRPRNSKDNTSTPNQFNERSETVMDMKKLKLDSGLEGSLGASMDSQSGLDTPHDNVTPEQKKRGGPRKSEDFPPTPGQSKSNQVRASTAETSSSVGNATSCGMGQGKAGSDHAGESIGVGDEQRSHSDKR